MGASYGEKIVLTRSAVNSVIASVLSLCLIHAATLFFNNQREVVFNYGASALYILQGEYYRVVTALMLHADIEHLAGNVAGMVLLATPLCSMIGAARGLFLILLSAAAGNLLNAYLYRGVNLSIGASTAVMSAVGILVSLQIIRHHHEGNSIPLSGSSAHGLREGTLSGLRGSALFIIASGAAFVGMMSGGKYADLSAHVFGFLAGLIVGFPSLIAIKRLEKRV